MKRPIATAAAIILAATGLTACSTSNDSKWYAENCTTQTATIQERPGEHAITAGPLAAPAALENSNQKIGYFTYDELNDGMKQEAPLEAGDTICLDQTIDSDNTRQKTIDTPKIEGEINQAQYDTIDFSFVRSPKYPEGIWINQYSGDISGGYAVSDLSDEKCDNQWWPSITTEEAGAANSTGEVMQYNLARQEKC